MRRVMEAIHLYQGASLHYYEVRNNHPPLVLIHAQGVCGLSYSRVFQALASRYHIYALDCYGHGQSSHEPALYNLVSLGEAVISFLSQVAGAGTTLVGHSSGGLIAAYAARSPLCARLFLEDPPLFSSQGERRYQTFQHQDLATLCHNFLAQEDESDFVLYYFSRQKAWEFFPDKSREQIRKKLIAAAVKFRRLHPEQNLWVPFWPRAALEGFRGMQHYDPRFGQAFYDDSFHCGFSHESLLRKISCDTVIMKARSNISEDGVLLAAMCDEDAEHARALIPGSQLVQFDCGHGIHTEMRRAFVGCLLSSPAEG